MTTKRYRGWRIENRKNQYGYWKAVHTWSDEVSKHPTLQAAKKYIERQIKERRLDKNPFGLSVG